MYASNPFANDFDDGLLKKGGFFLNRDRSDSINVFKHKSPGIINEGFDDSPNVSPVLQSQTLLPFTALNALANNNLSGMLLPHAGKLQPPFYNLGYSTQILPRQMMNLAAQPFQ